MAGGTVSGNSAADGSNLFLSQNGSAIMVTGALTEGAGICVTAEAASGHVFTEGYSTANSGHPGSYFHSDSEDFIVELENGEAVLTIKSEIVFDAGGGEGVMETVPVGRGAAYLLPDCDFTAPAGQIFAGVWKVEQLDSPDGTDDGAAEVEAGKKITVNKRYVRLTAVWEEISEDTVIIKSANVEFRGKIRLQFAFSFPENVLTDEGAYVTFEKAGTTTKMLISEGTAGADSVSFIIPIPAPEYADDIVVRVYDGEDSLLTLKSVNGTDYTENGFVYSVKTYAQNKSQSGSTESIRALAKALDDYGTAAQIFFQYGDTIGLSVDSAVSAVTPGDLAPYALTVTGTKPDGVTGAGIVVAFDTDNTLRVTFKTDGSRALGGYTFLLDGTETVPRKSCKNGYLQVKNIAAPNLDTPHTFTVTDGTNTSTVTASALSYAYTSVKNGDSDRQNLGKALYLYNQAADAHFVS